MAISKFNDTFKDNTNAYSEPVWVDDKAEENFLPFDPPKFVENTQEVKSFDCTDPDCLFCKTKEPKEPKSFDWQAIPKSSFNYFPSENAAYAAQALLNSGVACTCDVDTSKCTLPDCSLCKMIKDSAKENCLAHGALHKNPKYIPDSKSKFTSLSIPAKQGNIIFGKDSQEENMKKNVELNKTLKPKSAKAKSVVDIVGNVKAPYKALTDLKLYPTSTVDELVGVLPAFARPCPLTPVHGFVDSRMVKTKLQFEKLVKEVENSGDKLVEILLMPKINARYSAIVTPKNITIGEGNDGATGGNQSVVINTPNNITPKIVSYPILSKYTKAEEVPFVEVVFGNIQNALQRKAYVVQVRSGNQPDGLGSDYIPEAVVVKNVHTVTPDTDLLKWKTQVEKMKKGDVIYAASLSCHGAIHGVINKIPVVTSHVPKVGEVLVAGKIEPVDANRVSTLLQHLIKSTDDCNYDRIIHGWKLTHTLGSNNLSGGEEVIAYALYNLMMGGVAACLGEYRHAKGKKIEGFDGNKASRDEIFRTAFADKKKAMGLIYRVWTPFLTPNKFAGGFGGKAWGACVEATVELQRAVSKLIKAPSEALVSKAIEAANDLAHAQHNGGILFNKFGQTSEDISSILSQPVVIEGLLKLKKVQSAKLGKVFVKVMDKPTPPTVSKQLAKQKEYLQKAKEKEAAYLEKEKKKAEKLAKLQEKYNGMSLAEKMATKGAKFQIRLVNKNSHGYNYRLQMKYAGIFDEIELVRETPLPLPEGKDAKTFKSFYPSSHAKYFRLKLVSSTPEKAKFYHTLTFELLVSGTKIVLPKVGINHDWGVTPVKKIKKAKKGESSDKTSL